MKRDLSITPKSSIKSFTLIELIVVIIIVGILAAVGLTQYSRTVERGRISEAKIRIGLMRQLAYEYYMNNGTFTSITNSDVGVDYTCTSSGFYRYLTDNQSATKVWLSAYRCTSGGKTPNASIGFFFFLRYEPPSEVWYCWGDECLAQTGLPKWPGS